MADQDEVVDGAGIRDDNRHGSSEPQRLEVAKILVQILDAHLIPDAMRLEKTVDLKAALEAQQATQLRLAEPSRLILFNPETFQRPPRQIRAAYSRKPLREIIGDFEIYVHWLRGSMVFNADGTRLKTLPARSETCLHETAARVFLKPVATRSCKRPNPKGPSTPKCLPRVPAKLRGTYKCDPS